VLSHRPLLVCEDLQVAQRLGPAEQHETGCAVVGKAGVRIGLVDGATDQPSRAREAAALVTYGWQEDAAASSGVPDIVATAALDGADTLRCFEYP
jgi:hypothetical protein